MKWKKHIETRHFYENNYSTSKPVCLTFGNKKVTIDSDVIIGDYKIEIKSILNIRCTNQK